MFYLKVTKLILVILYFTKLMHAKFSDSINLSIDVIN